MNASPVRHASLTLAALTLTALTAFAQPLPAPQSQNTPLHLSNLQTASTPQAPSTPQTSATPPPTTAVASNTPVPPAESASGLAALGDIAVLPGASPDNPTLKYLQAHAGPQLHTLTPDDLLSRDSFSPKKYRIALYLGGDTFTSRVKATNDVEKALRTYMLSGGTFVVASTSPDPLSKNESGKPATTAERFGLRLLDVGQTDDASTALSFDTPPDKFEALFSPADVMLPFWGTLPSRLSFPAGPNPAWRALLPYDDNPRVYEPWITLKDNRTSKKYGDAAAYVRRVSTDGSHRAYHVAYLSGALTQNSAVGNVQRDAVLGAFFAKLAAKVEAVSGTTAVSDRAHIFYYPWYGTPTARQPQFRHWDQGKHAPPDDIGANYFPKLGAYSSADPAVIAQHMKWIRQARVGVVTVSWWGRSSYEETTVRAILDAAHKEGLQVNFHLEPYAKSTPGTFADDVGHLLLKYGRHPAFYRYNGHPVFYVYEVVRHPIAAWREANDKLHRFSVEPVYMIGQTSDLRFIKLGAFDGGYTYDGLAPFKKPNFTADWTRLAADFKAAGKLFIPSFGPGYWDDRAVPPPGGADEPEAAKTRDGGKSTTYTKAWADAIKADVPIVSITSFNEWHEGSQIEPAVEKKIDGYTYPAYPGGENAYLKLTAEWVQKLLE